MMELYSQGITQNVGLVSNATKKAAQAVKSGFTAATSATMSGSPALAVAGSGGTQVIQLVVDGRTLAEIVNKNNKVIQRANNS